MPRYWIVIADASYAYIYSAKKIGGSMQLVEEMAHPISREKRLDLVTDRPSLDRNPSSYGTVPSSSDPKDIEEMRFAHEISEHLEVHALKNHFDRLVLVAPPRFLGKLHNQSKPHWREKEHLTIEKDYVHMPSHELPRYLEEQLP